MADLVLECESPRQALQERHAGSEVEGKNIYDILEMTVNQAIEFYGTQPEEDCQEVAPATGWDWVISSWDSLRLPSREEKTSVKLAYFLSIEKAQPTIFVFG